MEGSILILNTR